VDETTLNSMTNAQYEQIDNLKVTLNQKGTPYYSKTSYPLRFGTYSEIITPDYSFLFNLNSEIKIIQGKHLNWPRPNEWLKRSVSNDWVYYSSAGYKGVQSFTGEYYLPCFAYSENPLFKIYKYDNQVVTAALNALQELFEKIEQLLLTETMTDPLKINLKKIIACRKESLQKKADIFHAITSGNISVLPPDSRHVNYDVIPVNVADGCLYDCGFCSVKTGKPFRARGKIDILNQIRRLKALYGPDIANYHSIFLGQHDALLAGMETIEYAALSAYEQFNFKQSNMKNPMLFMFGSVDALLNSGEVLFNALNSLPFYIYINIGMESVHPETLKKLNKPVTATKVRQAFDRMLEINRKFCNVEITANFVMGNDLSLEHYESMVGLTRNRLDRFYSKGGFYLSSLEKSGTTRDVQQTIAKMKNESLIPVYLYLIQRL
jgi:hypothetical protein